MKYEVEFSCTNGEQTVQEGYVVSFAYDPDQYGNGTFMRCENKNPMYCDFDFDIRYDRDYSEDRQMQFILDWVLNYWSGKKGSYRAFDVRIKEVA